MRVRYQFVGKEYFAECDMTERNARKRFHELKKEPLCMWAELVAEDEDEGGYMDVIDCDDKTHFAEEQYKLLQLMREMFG